MSDTPQDLGAVLATIIESCSTNTVGYSVTITADGSALTQVDGGFGLPAHSQEFPPGTIDAKTLQTLLAAVGDVSKIPLGFCMKPTSFATTTKIVYNNKTVNFVVAIQKKLTINVMRQAASSANVAVLSGSTPDRTFNVAIHQDGSGAASVCFKTHSLVEKRDYPAGTFNAAHLSSLLTKIGDVSQIPIETIEIACAGNVSGNLRSIQELGSGCDQQRLKASLDLANLLQTAVNKCRLTGDLMASYAQTAH